MNNSENISPEEATRRLLTRYGYTEDELKVLFKSDTDLLTFYNTVSSNEKLRGFSCAEETLEEEEDDYVLSSSRTKELGEEEAEKDKAAFEKTKKERLVKKVEQGHSFEDIKSSEITYEETKQALEDATLDLPDLKDILDD